MNVFLIGDSTVSDYPDDQYPQTGWGQVLDSFFNDEVDVHNYAKSGASTKSFISEGRFSQVEAALEKGDYLFIQFGHNDQKQDQERHTKPYLDYTANLTYFVKSAIKKGAKPILVTPVARRQFSQLGNVIDSHGDYTKAVRELAITLSVPLIDLAKRSANLYERYGIEQSKLLFLWIEQGLYNYFPEGKSDNTHFSLEGAKQIAQLVIDELKLLTIPLIKYLKLWNEKPVFIPFSIDEPIIPAYTCFLSDFGGIADGIHDNTKAFHQAISHCDQQGGGKIIIEDGIWLTGPLKLKSKIELHLKPGAIITFSPILEDYPLIKSSFEGQEMMRCQAPIDGEDLSDIAITGTGIIDGTGQYWRPTEKARNGARLLENQVLSQSLTELDYQQIRDYLRPNLVSIRRSKRIKLKDVTFQNAPAWTIHPWCCQNVVIEGVKIRNPWYAQNGDGLDIESCCYVYVNHCQFDVGDDAICLKAGREADKKQMPCQHVLIENCRVFHGHGGFVIGSEMSGDVRDVKVRSCQFIGTDKGIRIKSKKGRGGVIEYIQLEKINMFNIEGEAISIRMDYTHENEPADPRHNHLVPLTRHIWMEEILVSGANKLVNMIGLPEQPLVDITIRKLIGTADKGIQCINSQFISFIDIKSFLNTTTWCSLIDVNHLSIESVTGNLDQSNQIEIAGESNRITYPQVFKTK
ncbi:glycosyl hydrolase family 28 protein [Amphibacillus cookii]|uniref:glycosyl hydrolase family 28 protein n=1 Tax=Amphibacillus cookii TaxID=767787 RepID=UPI0019565FA3|nr:DNA sulfur modification protein DndE [Amphibacillus cookii]